MKNHIEGFDNPEAEKRGKVTSMLNGIKIVEPMSDARNKPGKPILSVKAKIDSNIHHIFGVIVIIQ